MPPETTAPPASSAPTTPSPPSQAHSAFTHLPSNLLLAAIAFAPNLTVAITLLLAGFALSQMDVPTRQTYVMAVVDPTERTAAAAYTNTARYLTRPIAPLIAGAALKGALGAPFLIAGAPSRAPTTPASTSPFAIRGSTPKTPPFT